MDELKTNAQALLERAKPGFAPSSAELERLRRRLSSGPTPPPDDAAPPPPKAANWAWYAGALVVAGLLAAGAAVVASTPGDVVADAAPRPAPPLASPAPTKTATAPALSPASSTAVVAPSLAPLPDPADSSSITAEPSPSEVRPPAPKRAAPRRAAEPPATDTFAAELELIMAARKALEARAFTTARTTAQRYLRRFEDGSFGEEAEVLRLLAGCGIERSDEVKARARAYARSHDSAFARRVRLACLDDPH